jgi:hypothetical protein
LAQPAAEKKEPPPAPPPRTPAEQVLDRAVEKARKLGAFDTRFRHTVTAHGMKILTDGRFALAPGRKVLYEFAIDMADGKGSIKWLCDGKTVYRVRNVLDELIVTSYDLAKVDEAQQNIKDDRGELEMVKVEEILEEFAAEHGFAGVKPLLADLQKRMTFARHESTVFTGSDGRTVPAYLLEGEWNKSVLDKMAPIKKADDPNTTVPDARKLWEERKAYFFVPRKARLYLARDGGWPWTDSLWPLRLELLGATRAGGSDELLLRLDIDPPAAQVPPDSLFQLTEAEKKVKALSVDPVLLLQRRRDLAIQRKRSLDEADRAPARSPLTPPPPPGKPQ